MTAGYSGTALIKKLGIKPGMRLIFVDAPADYAGLLGIQPEAVVIADEQTGQFDFIHVFTTSQADLRAHFPRLKRVLKFDGMLWVSWPKKASKVETDVDENVIRAIGLENGLVDVKVAAIDAVWSGLKFVYRLQDRTETMSIQ